MYNTSRPWLEDALVPLTNGYGASFGWNWRIQKSHQIHLLPELSYLKFSSSSSNNGKKFLAGFRQISFGMSLRIHPKAIFKRVKGAGPLGTRFFLLAGAGYNAIIPFSKTNGYKMMWDKTTPYRALSYTADVKIGVGYHLHRMGRCILTPEFAFTWMPSIELTEFAKVVNGHNVVGLSNQASNVFMLNFGLRVTMIGTQKRWWDKPRQGDKT